MAMESSVAWMATSSVGALGHAYLLADRAGEAVALLQERIEAVSQDGNAFLPLCLFVLAQASQLEGRGEEAAHAASRALGVARRYEQHGSEAVLDSMAAQHASPEAERHYRSALALADEPDADLHVHAVHVTRLLRVAPHQILHPERRIARPNRVVLVGEGRAEQRHDPVTHDLVHRAFVAVDRFHHPLDDGV